MENQPLFDLSLNKGFEFIWGAQFPKWYIGPVLQGADIRTVQGHFGEFIFQYKIKKGYSLWYSHYNIIKRVQTHARLQGPLIELSLLFTPDLRYHLQPFGKIKQKCWQFNLFHSTELDNKTQFEAGSLITTLDIHLEVGLLEDLFTDFPDLIGPFLEQIHAGRPMSYFAKSMYATPEMARTIQMIRQQLMKPGLHDGYLDYLVCILVIQAMMLKTSSNYCGMRYDHVLKLRSLLDYLIEMALSDLSDFRGYSYYAKYGALSITTLKKYMRIVKGETLRDIWDDARLKASLEDVLHSDQTLTSIAQSYDFGQLGGFRKAFKRKFGVTPIKVRMTSGG